MASNDGLLRGVTEWCLHMETERKPYHLNCGCALHRQTAGRGVRKKVVSYKLRRAWSESCLVCTNATFSSSLTSSPATSMGVAGAEGGMSFEKIGETIWEA